MKSLQKEIELLVRPILIKKSGWEYMISRMILEIKCPFLPEEMVETVAQYLARVIGNGHLLKLLVSLIIAILGLPWQYQILKLQIEIWWINIFNPQIMMLQQLVFNLEQELSWKEFQLWFLTHCWIHLVRLESFSGGVVVGILIACYVINKQKAS